MAKFKKGDKKIEGSGRKKGTPNKTTLLVAERLRELNCDPIKELSDLLKSGIPPEEKLVDLKIIQTMMQYTFYLPKHPAEIQSSGGLQPPSESTKDMTDEEIEEALR